MALILFLVGLKFILCAGWVSLRWYIHVRAYQEWRGNAP